MDPSLLSVLPNLSVGVVSILALGYITHRFLMHLDERTKRHEAAMAERELALRQVEREVRGTLSEALGENTRTMRENVAVLGRVVAALDRLAWPEIIGTLAGDDTIFVAVRDRAAQQRVLRELQRLT